MALDKNKPFIGFHTRIGDHDAVEGLLKLIEQGLKPLGFNALILEFNPGFSYRCFPQYSTGTLNYEDAVLIREYCKKNGIKAIPLVQCLSHQSDHLVGGVPWPLLKEHPEFCETPEFIKGGTWPEFYTHSWCASNYDIYEYIFPMMDEIIEAFEADVVHIGLDEVFDIGECPHCKGKNKATLFADTVKHIHDHLENKGIETMMWGDRLLDAEKLGYTMWDADKFGMHPSFNMRDKITNDIVITDWHYDMHSHGYPSIEQFMKAGFHTIPAFASDSVQSAHFWKYCLEYLYLGNKYGWNGKMGGLLMTHWSPLTNALVDEILGGINGTIPKSDNIWASSEVGRCIQSLLPKAVETLNKI